MNAPVIVDRAETTASLRELMAQLAQGLGGSVLIEGEAGIGKSLILSAVNALAGERGFPFMYAAAEELDREFPLRTADLALASLGVSRRRASSPDEHWSPPAGDPVLAGVEAVLDCLDELSNTSPLVFAMDDVQWADDASLLVLDRLSHAARQQPVLVIGAFRPNPGRERLVEVRRSMVRRAATLLRLDPLEPDDAAQMAALRAGGEPGPGLRLWLDSAAGNPLFIRELVDALDRHGQLRTADGRVDVTPDALPTPIVISLEEVIGERISTLTAAATQVLRTAAVVGNDFQVMGLKEICGLDLGPLLELLQEAVTAGIIEQTGERLRFRHGLIRDSLRQSVPPAMRSALHAAAARALADRGAPPEQVASQLLQTTEDLPPWAAEWLAGDGSELVYQTPSIAGRLIEAALQTGSPDPRLWEELTVRLTRARFQSGDPQLACDTAVQVLSRTADPDLAAEMAWFRAYAVNRRAEHAEALALITDVEQRWDLSPVWAVRLRVMAVIIASTSGDRLRVQALAEGVLEEALRLGDSFAAAYVLHIMCVHASFEGDPVQALAHLDRALEIAEFDLAGSDLRILLLCNRCIGLKDLGRSEEAAQSLETARALAERTGSVRMREITQNSGGLHFEEGRWDQALADLTAAVTNLSVHIPARALAASHGFMAQIHAHRGDAAKAREQLAEVDAIAAKVSIPAFMVPALLARSTLAQQENDPVEALAVLAPVLDEESYLSKSNWHMVLPTVLRLARLTGRQDLETRVRAMVEGEPAPDSSPLVVAARLHCQAILEQDVQAGRQAARLLRGLPFHVAECLETVAELLASVDRTQARKALTEAVDLYESLGAVVDAARTESRLRARGIRLGVRGARRRPAVGWESLTSTEARVAELVAEGMTNPEIAARMFISRRTVQTHVSQILMKLDVAGRSGIVRQAVERRGA